MALKRLSMKNFRGHADTQVVFDDESQLTLLAGRNGAGKTSVLEAISYAFYGIGRSNKTTLDRMVRWGSDLEGMDVELDFTVGSAQYTVKRRYEGGNSYAQLLLDDEVVMQGPKEVTRKVTQLFGMDAKGFKLAAFATQKELNGLASLSAADRAKTVSRLMRADVFTKARDEARRGMNDTKKQLAALGEAPDVEAAEDQCREAEENLKGTREALEAAQAEASALSGELESRADVQERFRAASGAKAKAEGHLESAVSVLERATADLGNARESVPPKPDVPDVDIDRVQSQLDAVTEELTAAKEAERARKDRDLLSRELEEIEQEKTHLSKVVSDVGGSAGAAGHTLEAERQVTGVREKFEKCGVALQEAHSQATLADHALTRAKEQLSRAESLTPVCETCHQEIPEENREQQVADATAAVEEATGAVERARVRVEELSGEREDLAKRGRQADEELTRARATEQQVVSAEQRLQQVSRTERMYRQRMESLPESDADPTEVAERRANLAAQLQRARSATRELTEWERRNNAVESAEIAVDRATIGKEQAEQAVAAAEIPQELLDAVEELGVLANRLAAEKELAAECTTMAAVAEQELRTAQQGLERIKQELDRRNGYVSQAETFEATARLLTATSTHTTNQIRPALAGAASAILSTMSEGHFDTLKLSKDYTVTVRAGGKMRSLGELSGGEQDLVALSLRLGLAAVVASRNGSSGPGFLVLDEVFGSQDVGRREAILNGLRTLRRMYPQVLLVSHVDGAEDQVDVVLEVSQVDPDEDEDASVLPESVVTAK